MTAYSAMILNGSRESDEQIERQSGGWRRGLELSLGAREIECAEGLMDEHGPTGRPDKPWDRNASTVRAELIATLSAAHAIGRSAPIELRTAFAKTKQRSIPDVKGNSSRVFVDLEFLDAPTLRGRESELQSIGNEGDRSLPCLDRRYAGDRMAGCRREVLSQRTVVEWRHGFSVPDRRDRQTERASACI